MRSKYVGTAVNFNCYSQLVSSCFWQLLKHFLTCTVVAAFSKFDTTVNLEFKFTGHNTVCRAVLPSLYDKAVLAAMHVGIVGVSSS